MKQIDRKRLNEPGLDMTGVGRLMAELSSSQPVRASAIAALQLAFDAPHPHRLYAEVMRKTGDAARGYAEALAPGVPEALKTFHDAAAGADPVARARAYDALMTDFQAVAYLAPPKDEYRSLLGCTQYGRGGLLTVKKMPVPGLLYCQMATVSADVVERYAATLSPSNLILDGSNGAFLVWFAHVETVKRHARLVGAKHVIVSRIGKSSTTTGADAGGRVNVNAFVVCNGALRLNPDADSAVFKGWDRIPGAVVGYEQRYILAAPSGDSAAGELFVAYCVHDQLSGFPVANISPCGPASGTPYFAEPQGVRVRDPGQAAAIADAIGSLGGLSAAFAAPADGAAVRRVADPMLQHQFTALLALLGGGRTDAATAWEAAARHAAAARAGVPIPGAGAPVVCLSMLGAGFVIMGRTVFDVVPPGSFQVRPLPARVRRRWVVARGAV